MRWGLVNSFTLAAQGLQSVERIEVERLAGTLLATRDRQQRQVHLDLPFCRFGRSVHEGYAILRRPESRWRTTMLTLAAVLKQLEVRRARTQAEVERLEEAIAALRKLGARGGRGRRGQRRGRPPGKKLSAAARRKIARAQKARWAKVRKEKAGQA